MLENVHSIGKAIRKAYHWTNKKEVPIYLILDNAGGHGTIETKKQYEDTLKKDYNVILDWQVPNSPETNLLDLGAWMAIQSEVEYIHRTLVMQHDVLSRTVNSAFQNIHQSTFHNIHKRWLTVLDIIIDSNRENNMVETRRNKEHDRDSYSEDTHDDSTGEYTDDEEEEYELVNGEDLVGYESKDDSSDEENHEDGYEEEDFILVEDD